jgi:hypothetical protein
MNKRDKGLTDGSLAVPGTVYADAVYRADELKARMGWRDAAFRAACRRGLKTHRVGKRVYVTGADAIAFVTGRGVVG